MALQMAAGGGDFTKNKKITSPHYIYMEILMTLCPLNRNMCSIYSNIDKFQTLHFRIWLSQNLDSDGMFISCVVEDKVGVYIEIVVKYLGFLFGWWFWGKEFDPKFIESIGLLFRLF